MKENNSTNKNIHVGHNISRFRHLRGLKQETLADMIGITQQTMSHHEQQKVVNYEILKKVASALKVPEDVLQKLEDDNTTFIIENSIFSDNDNCYAEQEKESSYNQIDRIIELMEKLLDHEKQKTKQLEGRLNRLEDLIKESNRKINKG